jgi:hypothetical protein
MVSSLSSPLIGVNLSEGFEFEPWVGLLAAILARQLGSKVTLACLAFFAGCGGGGALINP